VHGLIRAVVERQVPMFAHFPEHDADDLFSEARDACERAWPRFDPDKSSVSTFISIIAHRRLISLYRSCARRATREARVAVMGEAVTPANEPTDADDRALTALAEWADAQDAEARADGLLGGLGEDQTIEDWAGTVYRQAKRTFPAYPDRRGRKWYSTPQAVTCVLLIRKYGWTTREAERQFADSPDLCRALQLRRVPDHSWFARAGKFATRNFRLFRRARVGGE
jgi:hypothetical protein